MPPCIAPPRHSHSRQGHLRGMTVPYTRHHGPPCPGRVMRTAGTPCKGQGPSAGGWDGVHGGGTPCVKAGALWTPGRGAGKAPGERSRTNEEGSAFSAGSVRESSGWARGGGHVWARGGGTAVPAVGRGARPLPRRASWGPPCQGGTLHGSWYSGRHLAPRRTPARRRSPGDLAQRPMPGPRRSHPPPLTRSPVPARDAR